MDKTKRDEAMRRSGDMLLGGWKMLGTLCPLCNTALMEKADSLMCPSCNLPILRESEDNSTFTSTPPAAPSNSTPSCGYQGGLHEYAAEEKVVYKSLEDAKREYDKTRSHQNLVSNKIGEKLLLGWTLLSVECQWPSCPGVPMMRNKASPPVQICPACERIQPQNEVGGASQEYKAGPLPPPAYPMEAPYLDDNGEVIEDGASPVGKMKEGALVDVSHLISQKMLQGWALLDKACEIGCGGDTPLLRDPKTRQEYCVICGYLDEDGAAVVQAAKTVPATGSGERCDSSSDDEDSVDSDRALAAYADKRVRDILSASAASAAAPRQSPDRTTGRLPEDIAVTALDEKIISTVALLERSSDVMRSLELAQLIKALMEAKVASKTSLRYE